MKKTIAMAAAMIVSFSAVCMNSFADEAETTKVYVTISDTNSSLVLTQVPVTVTDIDNDGKLTINDALYIAHEDNFDGGAKAGYSTVESEYGIAVDKLWGIENKLSYLFHVNSEMSSSMTDEIKNGDYVDAYMFPDPSDLNYFYSWFDKRDGGEVEPDTEVELTLSYASFDASWNRVVAPIKNAKITVNGKETDFVTDDEGKVTVKLTDAGKNVISAVASDVKVAPASYVVNVKGEVAATTSTTSTETTTTTTTAATTSTKAATKATAKTTAKAATSAATTKKKSDVPVNGDKGAGFAVFGIGAAVATAFALRRRNEK